MSSEGLIWLSPGRGEVVSLGVEVTLVLIDLVHVILVSGIVANSCKGNVARGSAGPGAYGSSLTHWRFTKMPKRILIAEDDQSQREIIARFAKLKGYDVVVVTDGVDLLKISTTERFDLIITDLSMPDLDGASATEIMKLQDNTIPVIALTAFSPNQIDLVRYTFTKIFHKPCDYNELFEYVESLIGK